MKYLLFCLTVVFFSCSGQLSNDDKTQITNQINNNENCLEILSINSGEKVKGNIFSFQKFSIRVKFQKKCGVNISEYMSSSQFNATGLVNNERSDKNAGLILQHYGLNDSLTIQGLLFSTSSNEIFNPMPRCLFYVLGKKDSNDSLNAQICSELEEYEKTGLQLLRLTQNDYYDVLLDKGRTLADKFALRFIASEIAKAKFLRDRQLDKIDEITFRTQTVNTSLLIYWGIELKNLSCNNP